MTSLQPINTASRHADRTSPNDGPWSRTKRLVRPALLIVGLMLVTACRLGDSTGRLTLPATWLLVALFVVAGWSYPRLIALGATLGTLFVWSWIEADAAANWAPLLPGQGVRFVVALWLVSWTSRLRQRLAQAEQLGRLDSLTGLPNRQALVEALDAELSRTRRFGRPFTVALLDCDGFKGINDRGGHLAGDEVLRRIGIALRQHTRRYDCVGRLGGDEFLLVLSEVDRESAALIVERLRAALRHFVEREYPMLTFSLGVVTFRTANFDWEECVQQADDAMYAAKRQGPDQTRFEVVDGPTTRTLPLPK
jgi:diguanylate cyclase (GGDEF)-like protein